MLYRYSCFVMVDYRLMVHLYPGSLYRTARFGRYCGLVDASGNSHVLQYQCI